MSGTRLPNGNASEQTPRIYEVTWYVRNRSGGDVVDGGTDRVRIGWTNGKPYTTFADIPKIVSLRLKWTVEDLEIHSARLVAYGD